MARTEKIQIKLTTKNSFDVTYTSSDGFAALKHRLAEFWPGGTGAYGTRLGDQVAFFKDEEFVDLATVREVELYDFDVVLTATAPNGRLHYFTPSAVISRTDAAHVELT